MLLNKLKAVHTAMKPSDKLKPNLWDLLSAAAVVSLAAACAVLFWSGLQKTESPVVTIRADGETVREIPLRDAGENETFLFSHNGVTMTLVLNPDGETGVAVKESDCPNEDCVRTGTVTRSGESIVCLPARTVITLLHGESSGVDAIIG